jgi:hypothetical protein
MRLSAKTQKNTSHKTTRRVSNASAPQLSRYSALQYSQRIAPASAPQLSRYSALQYSQRIAPASAPAAIQMSVLSKKKRTEATLMNIPDDILTVLYKNLDVSQLMIMYRLNTSFSTKKGAMIDVEILDLTNVRIDETVIKFIEDNINKLKIKKIILDNISFVDDDVFNKFISSIRLRHLSNHYKDVEELVITNVKINNYFLTLIENIGFFSNLKILTITYTNIITQLNKHINEHLAFAESFVEMLGYLENLQHLIFDYNNIEPRDLQAITKGVRKINYKRRKMKLPEIKPYERSHNNTIDI